jgi:hypothetical protein
MACNGSSSNKALVNGAHPDSTNNNMTQHNAVQGSAVLLSDLINSGQASHSVTVKQNIVINPNAAEWKVTLGRHDRASAYVLIESGIQRWMHFKTPGTYVISVESLAAAAEGPAIQQHALTLIVTE